MVRTSSSALAPSALLFTGTRFKKSSRCAGIALLFTLGGAYVHATPVPATPLTLDEATRLAQERSQQLPAYQASAQAARELAVAAGQRPDPVIQVGINNLPINGPDRFSVVNDFMTMRSVSVMQEFTRQSKLDARANRFEREAQVAEANRELARVDLERDTALAWFDRHFAERTCAVLVAERDEANLEVVAAEAAYRGARGSQADVFAARGAVALIEDRLEQAERDVATATTQLSRWVGASGTRPLAAPPPVDTVRLRPQDLEGQLSHHPEIAAMRMQEAAAQAEADVARTEKKTDFSVQLMYSQRGPSYSNLISLNVSFPVQWDQENRQDRELAAKLATVEQMRAEREEATRTHVEEATAMLEQWQADRKRMEHYDESVLPLASERTNAALAAYRGGTGPLAAVLDARRAEIDARLDRLRIEAEAARLWVQINSLVAGHQRMPESLQEEQP